MPVFGFGHEVVTSTTKPANPSLGQMIYCTDTDEYLKYVSYGGANRWMQAVLKPGRRLNLNGAMTVWQRGTSTSSDGVYLADRYQCWNVTSVSRSSDVPSGSGFHFSISFGHSSVTYPLLMHKLEAGDSKRLVGKQITVSFWAKNVSGTAGIYVDFLRANAEDNWGSNTIWQSAISNNQPVTGSWAYYSFTSNACPAEVGNGFGIYIPRNNGAATTLVTGVQIEVGTAPSEFEFRQYHEELRACQRYFQFLPTNSVYVVNPYMNVNLSSGDCGVTQLMTTMRVAPSNATNTSGGAPSFNFRNWQAGGSNTRALNFTSATTNSVQWVYNNSSNGGATLPLGSAGGYSTQDIIVSAEL